MSDLTRLLSIKSGVVKRLTKDVSYSQQESQRERSRLEKLKADGGDEYEIRAQEKVIADADQMLPDYRGRLKIAVHELEELLSNQDAKTSEASDFITTAKSTLAAAQEHLR